MGMTERELQIIEQLYKEMYRQLYVYAMSALSNPALSEEAVQETFRIACSKAGQFIKSDNPKGWLMQTLKNVIMNTKRSIARLNKLLITAVPIEDMIIESKESELDFNIIYSDLLGLQEFEMLKMIACEKASMLEVAEKNGITLEACKKRVQRARQKLRKLIENNN